jgi:hypothetical protein
VALLAIVATAAVSVLWQLLVSPKAMAINKVSFID